MYKVKRMFRKLFTPVTIMCVPHGCSESYKFRVPAALIALCMVLSSIGAWKAYALKDDAVEYARASKELRFFKTQFAEMESTLSALTVANAEFQTLFSMENKEDVLDRMNASDTGSLDMNFLQKQISETIGRSGEIQSYLDGASNLYMATPMGWPVTGQTTSKFGIRTNPVRGNSQFHSGLDIAARPGTPVRVTADGIVSFSGRSGSNGNLVAVEHGFGYTTYYAHNKKIDVKVGQVVARGDVIAYVGSTGSTTGPHLHYEIWKNGDSVDPQPYVKGGNR